MKKHKIPDWWRCENCKWFGDEHSYIKGWNYCNAITSANVIVTENFGCIYFEPRKKNG